MDAASPILLIGAYLLDLVLGDPHWFPHPVRLIGKFISSGEAILRRLGPSPFRLRIAGILLALVTCLSVFWATRSLLHLAGLWSAGAALILGIILAYTTLATRDLQVETARVLRALEAGDLSLARRELSFLVGRETSNLSEADILRALIETIGENISDGVVAPLFYLGLGGPCWAMTYKAINTLDSMVGYKNERFIWIGWASARLDDLANFLPARISGLLIALSALMLGKPWRTSLRILRRDHAKHESPNSAWPEAAMSGALEIQLGGLNYYFGLPVQKPLIGERKKEITRQDVREAWKILYFVSAGMLLLALILHWTRRFLWP